MNLSDKSVLIYDFGLFTEIAVRLARDFGTVYYYVPWEEAFPRSNKALIGSGWEDGELSDYDGVIRVKDFEEYIDKVDMLLFPDVHTGSKVEYFRNQGYNVAGVGELEKIELDRAYARQLQEDVGLPTQNTDVLNGITQLKDHLADVENKYVKLNTFRGDIESFHHTDYESSVPILNHLQFDLGPKGECTSFIVEDNIEGAEPGLDCIIYDGEVLSPTMLGYEVGGAGYIARVLPYNELPQSIKQVTDKLKEPMKDYRFFFSDELKVNKTAGYLIDPTCRFAAPGTSAIQTELIENFSEVIWGLATGEKVLPVIKYKYGAALVKYSDWAENNWLKVTFPEDLRMWVKFRMAAKFDGVYWAVPNHSTIVTIIALGDTLDGVVKLASERAKQVDGYQLAGDHYDLKRVVDAIKEGEKYGIKF